MVEISQPLNGRNISSNHFEMKKKEKKTEQRELVTVY